VETPHILIVEGRFYEDIADELIKGATAELDRLGAEYERVSVPGAFEIPAAIHMFCRAAALRRLYRPGLRDSRRDDPL
jgi:6,7-dimethyl-8-ribityllumazine synthase